MSLKALRSRIERNGVKGNLHAICLSPTHIHGLVYWDNSNIDIVVAEDESFVIRDVGAGLEIQTADVEVKQNCLPIYTAGKRTAELDR